MKTLCIRNNLDTVKINTDLLSEQSMMKRNHQYQNRLDTALTLGRQPFWAQQQVIAQFPLSIQHLY